MPLRGSQPAGFGSPPGGLNANVRAARLRLPAWPLRCQGPAPALLLTQLPSQMAPWAPWILLGPHPHPFRLSTEEGVSQDCPLDSPADLLLHIKHGPHSPTLQVPRHTTDHSPVSTASLKPSTDSLWPEAQSQRPGKS